MSVPKCGGMNSLRERTSYSSCVPSVDCVHDVLPLHAPGLEHRLIFYEFRHSSAQLLKLETQRTRELLAAVQFELV